MRRQGGAITQDYTQTDIDTIIISTTDKAGGGHSFLTEEVGDLIQLFDVEDKNYGLFEIEAIDTATSTEYVSFNVKWLQGLGETHVDDDVLVKTFAPPTGGTASEFVAKAGDEMSGELWVDSNVTCTGEFAARDSRTGNMVGGRFNARQAELNYNSVVVLKWDGFGLTKLKLGNQEGNEGEVPVRVAGANYMEWKNILDFSQYDELT